MEEVWRAVKGFEGKYEVSNMGRIKSSFFNKEHILDTFMLGKYEGVSFAFHKTQSVRRITVLVHVIVAQAFPEICGELLEGYEVHHKDKNPLNNKADNLLCLSKEDHKKIHGYKKKKTFPYMFSNN